ncbi:MAG: hypothetical protein FJ044_05435 [Candidatus Cloacimonetes bacterium]|nr:hypothetical protein [Candidatus Cloacimonadota bacterium]
MKVDIDQSWRMEYTNKKTVLADSLGNSLILKAGDKKNLQRLFRKAGKSRMFVYEVFAGLLAILISLSHEKKVKYIYRIDLEYPGWSEQIKDFVLRFSRKLGIKVIADQIEFASIGRKSEAHQNAYKVFKGWMKPTRIVVADEILRLVLI